MKYVLATVAKTSESFFSHIFFLVATIWSYIKNIGNLKEFLLYPYAIQLSHFTAHTEWRKPLGGVEGGGGVWK